jgi:hypothetical protein
MKKSQRHQPTPPGAETIPLIFYGLNSLFVWFQHWLMVLCYDKITSCLVGAKKVALKFYFHLLQAPFGAAAAKEHRQHASL